MDPKPTFGISDYSCFGDNPIMLADPLGDKVIVDKSVNENKEQKEALEKFAHTKAGKKYLAQYAEAGQVIGGVTFDKSGKFNDKGIDVAYKAESGTDFYGDEKKGGQTGTQYKFDSKGNIVGATFTVTLFNGKGWKTSNELFNKVSTIAHESFIHVDLDTKDFLDDQKFNSSNLSYEAKNSGAVKQHWQHLQVRKDFIKNQWKSANAFPGEAYNCLLEVVKSNKIALTNMEVLSAMWNFSGGLKINNKTGDLEGSH